MNQFLKIICFILFGAYTITACSKKDTSINYSTNTDILSGIPSNDSQFYMFGPNLTSSIDTNYKFITYKVLRDTVYVDSVVVDTIARIKIGCVFSTTPVKALGFTFTKVKAGVLYNFGSYNASAYYQLSGIQADYYKTDSALTSSTYQGVVIFDTVTSKYISGTYNVTVTNSNKAKLSITNGVIKRKL